MRVWKEKEIEGRGREGERLIKIKFIKVKTIFNIILINPTCGLHVNFVEHERIRAERERDKK